MSLMVWHMTLNAPHIYRLWAWMFCDFPTGMLTGIFVVCANKLILPFKSGGKALSVTNADRERHLALPLGELAAKPTERAKNERINTDTLR